MPEIKGLVTTKQTVQERTQEQLDNVIAAIADTDRLLALPEVKPGSDRAFTLRNKRMRQVRNKQGLEAKVRKQMGGR